MSPWVAMTVCPGVGFTGRRSTATFLRGRLSTVTTDVPHDVLRHEELLDRLAADDAGE